MRTPVAVGVVGDGARAAAVARALDELADAELGWICAENRDARRRLGARHPGARTTADADAVLADESVDAVVVATATATRAGLVRRALEAQKHVLVDEPVATSSAEADALASLAARRDRRLVVANPLLFHPGLRKLKELVELGRLGDVYYLHALVQAPGEPDDEGVLWTLGAPLVSAIAYLLDDEPVESLVRGDSYACPGVTEVASCWFRFATGITASAQLSCLDARQARRIAVVCSRRTAVFDDGRPERGLSVFERGTPTRCGEIVSPRLATGDPVRLECESFVGAVRTREPVGARRALGSLAAVEELARTLGGAPAPAFEAHPPRLQLVRP